MLLKQQMLESLHDESWKLPVAYLFLSGSRTGHSGTGRKPGLKISIGSEHLSLSLFVAHGLCWLEASPESDWALYT